HRARRWSSRIAYPCKRAGASGAPFPVLAGGRRSCVMLNLAMMLEDSAARVPDRVAVVSGDLFLTYAQVNAEANRVANLLVDCGVRPGDRVALSCPNVVAFPIIYYGILKTGAVVVPLDTVFKNRDISHHLSDSGATVYLCHEDIPGFPIG